VSDDENDEDLITACAGNNFYINSATVSSAKGVNGGFVYIDAELMVLEISDSTFSNMTTTTGGYGGMIFIKEAEKVTIDGNTFTSLYSND
jgi:hypothetical protein